jgi:hypothetical protein
LRFKLETEDVENWNPRRSFAYRLPSRRHLSPL